MLILISHQERIIQMADKIMATLICRYTVRTGRGRSCDICRGFRDILYINDSKKIFSQKAEELYDIIMSSSVTGLGRYFGPAQD